MRPRCVSASFSAAQFVELGRFDFSSWEDLVKKTGVTPETLKLIQETFRRHLVSTEADASGWVEKPSTSTAAAAAASEGPPSIATESDNSKRAREYDVWIVEKLKKHKNCQADMERQDKVGLSHVGVLFGELSVPLFRCRLSEAAVTIHPMTASKAGSRSRARAKA